MERADRHVIFEFIAIGQYVKVTAVDPASLIEVSIVGGRDFGQELLKRTALRKLRRAIERRTALPSGSAARSK